jgi:hypothetical protein
MPHGFEALWRTRAALQLLEIQVALEKAACALVYYRRSKPAPGGEGVEEEEEEEEEEAAASSSDELEVLSLLALRVQKVLRLLALLVQKRRRQQQRLARGSQFTCFTGTKSTNTDAEGAARGSERPPQ